MSFYRKKEWSEFRDNVIESDGYKCTKCGVGHLEATLQVHHKRYISGRMPWEYGTEDCETLCKGCHAAEHGKIKPKFGWEYVGDEDLRELKGTCEKCGTTIRYICTIYHENWGYLEVGTMCCDNLTDSNIASNNRETQTKYNGRLRRFIKSQRWYYNNRRLVIKQANLEVRIAQEEDLFFLEIHGLESKMPYQSLIEAKTKAFEVIENGKLYDYLDKKGMTYRKKL